MISTKNAFLQACPVHHWQAHTKATRQSSEFKVSHWVLAVAQGQCQWCAEPAGQSGPSLPYLGTPISEIVPCWRDCATQHWETGSPSGCPPTWRNKEPQILTLKAATYPSILQLLEIASQRHFSLKFSCNCSDCAKISKKKKNCQETPVAYFPSVWSFDRVATPCVHSFSHQYRSVYWPSCFGTWPSILWLNTMKTRCSERRLYKYVVFVIACTWMASNSRGDFSGCRNILKIWRKDGRSALLNCRKLLGAFFTPPFTVDLRARGRGTCEGPPRYLLISLFVFSISRKHNSSVYFYNRRKVACSVV